MAVTCFNGQFSFKQDKLARLGDRAKEPGCAITDPEAFANSPFMQRMRLIDEAAGIKFSKRDQKRKQTDPSFNPKDTDFDAPKSHKYDRAMNYYKTLGVDEYATQEEVRKAYKRLSLVYHPDKTSGLPNDLKEEYSHIFMELKNAYQTLTDNPTRRQYDRDRDKDLAASEIEGWKLKERAQFDALAMLAKLKEDPTVSKGPTTIIDINLWCRLEKFVWGGQKTIERNRRVKQKKISDVWKQETKSFRIDVPKGAPEPFIAEFRHQGDQHDDLRPDTLRFHVRAKEHEQVVRCGVGKADLRVTQKVLLDQSAIDEPFIRIKTDTIRGRCVFLWGVNPFFKCASGAGDLRIRILGEGASEGGALHILARVGCTLWERTREEREFEELEGSFLARHQLGRTEEAEVNPTLRLRSERRARDVQDSEVTLSSMGEPMSLFTRPSCSLSFYSTLEREAIDHIAKEGILSSSSGTGPAMFAICVSSSTCSKGKAHRDWERLQTRLFPLLQHTCFRLLRPARNVMPRSLLADPPICVEGEVVGDGCRGELPMPWQRLGVEAFRRGDYWLAMGFYSKCLEELSEDEPYFSPQDRELNRDDLARVMANRAACFIRVSHYDAALQDAKHAAKLRPKWAKPWSRIGLAATKLGLAEALQAYRRAVEFEPTDEHVRSLAEVARRSAGQGEEAAHASKEEGNVSMRSKEWGSAVAAYTIGLARLPPEGGEDGVVFLRAVLLGNRSAAFSQLRRWASAVADGEAAVACKSDFCRARCRLGVALLGAQRCEEAYTQFAKVLKEEDDNAIARRGRQECLSEMILWRSVRAKARQSRRFCDMERPRGFRILAISDVHFDHKQNEEWAHSIDDAAFQEDVLIVAGNVADTKVAVIRGLTTLKSKFRRVFYTVGNHEMSIHPAEAERYPDSIAKLQAIFEACDEIGVDVTPSAVCKNVYVVPLLSWYNAEFDQEDPWPADGRFDPHCKWPVDPDDQVWRYMLKMNEVNLALPYHGDIITFSHFLPRRELPWRAEVGKKIVKSVGCERIDEQLRAVRSSLHVFGHTHVRYNDRIQGLMYVQQPVGYASERMHLSGGPTQLMQVYDRGSVCARLVDCVGA